MLRRPSHHYKEAFVAMVTEEIGDRFRTYADFLQKRLNYGLPCQESISYYEAGFSERVISQQMASTLFFDFAETSYKARNLIRENQAEFKLILHNYPSYFKEVFDEVIA